MEKKKKFSLKKKQQSLAQKLVINGSFYTREKTHLHYSKRI